VLVESDGHAAVRRPNRHVVELDAENISISLTDGRVACIPSRSGAIRRPTSLC